MRVAPVTITNSNAKLYSAKMNTNNLSMNKTLNAPSPSDTFESSNGQDGIAFKSRVGRIFRKALATGIGGAAGAAAGGAVIGGGTLAGGFALLTGPIGFAAVAAAYFIGGALAGGISGAAISELIEENPEK